MTDNETAIAIFGIVFGVMPICGAWINAVKSRAKIEQARLKIEEKKLELMAAQGLGFGEATANQVAALRAEIAALRDTSMQYDLSIQHALDETQHRLATLETKSRATTPATGARIDEAPLQKNGLG